MPNSTNTHPFAAVFTVTVGNPAAGANFSYACLNNHIQLPLTIHFTLTTAAAVANRYVGIIHNRGSLTRWESFVRSPQPASQVVIYSFAFGLEDGLTLVNFRAQASIPEKDFLYPGSTIESSIININAADQISDITLQFHNWVQRSV